MPSRTSVPSLALQDKSCFFFFLLKPAATTPPPPTHTPHPATLFQTMTYMPCCFTEKTSNLEKTSVPSPYKTYQRASCVCLVYPASSPPIAMKEASFLGCVSEIALAFGAAGLPFWAEPSSRVRSALVCRKAAFEGTDASAGSSDIHSM